MKKTLKMHSYGKCTLESDSFITDRDYCAHCSHWIFLSKKVIIFFWSVLRIIVGFSHQYRLTVLTAKPCLISSIHRHLRPVIFIHIIWIIPSFKLFFFNISKTFPFVLSIGFHWRSNASNSSQNFSTFLSILHDHFNH